jgi:hypothetical protein
MENKINLFTSVNPYLRHFHVAQRNFNKLIEEERLQKRIERSKRQQQKSEN